MPKSFLLIALTACLLGAQPRPAAKKAGPNRSFQAQATSSLTFADGGEDNQTVEITNASFELTNTFIPGRPKDQRLVLRKTTRSKEIFGDIGEEGTVTLDAWPFPADVKQKPLYSLNTPGIDGHTQDGTIFVVSRGVEEQWWAVYQLGTAQHLFDTYVPLLAFSISRDTVKQRYAGLDVPLEDAKDPRLKDPHAVAVVTYASAERLIREAILTCDDPKQAAQYRSLADEEREFVSAPGGKALKLSFSQSYPSAPATVTLQIPIANDDLDLAHAQLPAKMHLAAFKR